MKKNISNNLLTFAILLLSFLTVSCSEDIDNGFSRNKAITDISVSSDNIILNESEPDKEALSLEWTPTYDYGNDYIINYQYQISVEGSAASAMSEYEDDMNFKRSYTNAELQDILINKFNRLTSTPSTMTFRVTATIQGPRLVTPDIAEAHVKVKTYGNKQFLASKLWMSGSAVGDNDIEMARNENDTLVYTYTGPLSQGSIYFPAKYYDEENAFGPENVNSPITAEAMAAVVTEKGKANSWLIPEKDNYRVTVNLKNHSVTIVSTSSEVSLDQVFMTGTATSGSQIELERTLEDDNIYAFHGSLNAGTLYLPVMKDGKEDLSIVPKNSSSHNINDGVSSTFTQVATGTAANGRYWNIEKGGTYRVVLNLNEKTITIYSPSTDPTSMEASWNNTTLKINPYKTVIEKLWMYGTFNAFAHDAGAFVGYQDKYTLKQSKANPYIFVYKGEALPRSSQKDERGNSITGSVKFTIDNTNNNVYAFGSSANAKRNDHNGYITVTDNSALKLVAGQSDNRFAYFIIPENCNFIVVDIKNLVVKFDHK
ncbi:MAG: SusE domain-containing protein [Prevotella sp.]|jgi:hypothetical protein|nr:SusE domain-containing protein [Prevotella sp.]MCI1281931.1 SusE domain-containing protein [Prevotella sp.]